jgi:type I restriction enzyme S subunit
MNNLKAYDKYKPSGVEWLGDVPEHWEVKKLKYLGNSIIGLTYNPKDLCDKDEGTLVLRSSNIHDGKLVLKKNVFVKSQIPYKLRTREKDIIICSRNGSRNLIGKCALINSNNKNLSFGAFTTVYRSAFNDFIFHILNSNIFKAEAGKFLTSTINQLTIGTLNSFIIPFPPIQEQTKIANYLDRKTAQINQAIAQKEQLIALLKERQQILIHQELENVKQSSKVIRLKYLIVGKLKYGANESGILYSKELPRYIRITDFGQDGKLDDKTKLSLPWKIGKEYLLKDGDILFARSGATVGKTYQFKISMSEEKYFSYAGYLIKAEVNPDIILSDYLYLFTNSDYFNNWKEGIFNKATIENIGADKYAQLSVIVPTIDKQIEILEFIKNQTEKIQTAISLKQQEIARLKEYKTVLIDAAVTGKVLIEN